MVLLSPPGVFGGVETGQVSVLFDDVHLLRRPTEQWKDLRDIINLASKTPNFQL